MGSDEFTLDFQIGTTKKAHKILGQLSVKARTDSDTKKRVKNPKAPFDSFADAYMMALMLGLSTGNKIAIGKGERKNYANFNQTVAKDVDVFTLLKYLGEDGDLENQDSARKAIEEYATWGLMKMDASKLGDDDYRIGDLLENLLG